MFDPDTFKSRREKLLKLMRPNSIAVAPAAPTALYSNDTDYRYRPDSNLYYLTGFREPESVAVLSTVDGAKPFTLFVRPRDPAMETWNGKRAGVDGAKELYLPDEVFEIGAFKEKLPLYLENIDVIYHIPGRYPKFDRELLIAWQSVRLKWRQGIDTPYELHDLGHLLHEIRLIKSDADLAILRQACNITSEGHILAMKSIRPGMNERDIEALVEHYYRSSGAFGPGFPTIAASGPNATILHHIENSRDILDGDLILLDAGCEYEMFNADITRTFPANGKFTPEQRAIYDLVLKANETGMEMCTTKYGLNEMHEAVVKILVDGLIGLKLLKGPAERALEEKTYAKYYMHRSGHWLGVDVHDVGSSRKDKKWRLFEPGMVTTVEPGLYIPEDDEWVPQRFRGIGVRIEDDVAITSGAPDVLTALCPKDPDELESIIGK